MSWFVVENVEVCFFCNKSSDTLKTIKHLRKNVNWCRKCSFIVLNDYITECHFCYSDMYTEDHISPTATISECGKYCIDSNVSNNHIFIGKSIIYNNQNLYWCNNCSLEHSLEHS